MPKSRGRKKPKRTPAGRRPRPAGASGPSMRMELDAVTHGIMSAPPLLAPVFALVATWMWNAAEDRSPAGSCVDSGIIFTGPWPSTASRPASNQSRSPSAAPTAPRSPGAELLVHDGRYVFRHPATGRLLQLADIPFAG